MRRAEFSVTLNVFVLNCLSGDVLNYVLFAFILFGINNSPDLVWLESYASIVHTAVSIKTDLGLVVQSPISTNPGLSLDKTYGINTGLALIGL